MGAKVKVRVVTYVDDSIKIRRLRDAVKLDTQRPLAWREPLLNHLDEAMKLLLTAPDPTP